MTQMVKFPHIEQFRNVVRQVTNTARYAGKDENGEPIYNPNILLPTLKFEGTPKLHGTNAAIGFNNDGSFWCQSRENIITPEKDNAGFATFCHRHKEVFADIFSRFDYNTWIYKGVVLYGEFAGGNIQKGVALTELEKMFVAFKAKLIAYDGSEFGNAWLTRDDIINAVGHHQDQRIFNIYTFGHWEIEIDFNRPEQVVNDMIAITEKIEECCPVGKYFGVEGVGEGAVYYCVTAPYIGGNFMFKVKGQKHSASKVKKLASVDVEKVNSIQECVEKIITETRLNQGLDHLRMNGLEISPKSLGELIKWVNTDAIREELDTIVESGLEPKDIGGAGAKFIREWFLKGFNDGSIK